MMFLQALINRQQMTFSHHHNYIQHKLTKETKTKIDKSSLKQKKTKNHSILLIKNLLCYPSDKQHFIYFLLMSVISIHSPVQQVESP